MSSTPTGIIEFVKRQKTQSVDIEWEPRFPYGEYHWRVSACILLSGMVRPKSRDGFPNMTDVNRVCKEANFNQYLLEWVGKALVTCRIIGTDWSCFDRYKRAANFDAFWELDLDQLRTASVTGFLEFFDSQRGHHKNPHEELGESDLTQLLTLFFAQFPDQAVDSHTFGRALLKFSELPSSALCWLARKLGIDERVIHDNRWPEWLDKRGREAAAAAAFSIGWANTSDEEGRWLCLNPTGRIILGLAESPARTELNAAIEVLPDGSVLAGIGAPVDRLLPLFRHCRIVKLGPVSEFKVDKQALSKVTVGTSAEQELTEVFEGLGPLPPAITKLLDGPETSPLCGQLKYRYCSGIVKPATPEMAKAIRAHPRLKGYIEPGAPTGYLLIKPNSNFDNFLVRCRELGFELLSL